jgi:N-acetyl-gamma-glutamyl-phosphate reductase
MSTPQDGAAHPAAPVGMPVSMGMPGPTTMRCAVVGATGYVGRELVALLQRHPAAELVAVMSARAGAVPPPPAHPGEPSIDPFDPARLAGADVVFLATPHGAAAPLATAALEAGARVVDLSADFRLADPALYAQVYGAPHAAPELLDAAVYALVERARPALRGARLAACPGCYPTSVLLPSLPLLDAGAIAAGSVLVANSASGVSGAGKEPTATTLFGNVDGNFRAYGVGTHRHRPEIQQELDRAAGDAGHAAPQLVFVPHLLPTFRGILTTLYVEAAPGWTAARMRATLASVYADEPFVHVLAEGQQPGIADVARSNRCHIAVSDGGGRVVVTAAIDNLVKGAAGQGVQAANCMFGLQETLGIAGGGA